MPDLSLQLQYARAVLIGASEFPKDHENLPDLPAVENNLTDLKGVLENSKIIGIPSANVVSILNATSPTSVLEKLDRACRECTDTLIVYYAGHGMVTKEGAHFTLALHDTTEDQAHVNALMFSEVGELIKSSPAQRKILILDCCFSGRALAGYQGGSMSMLQSGLRDTGSYSIAAAPANARALAPLGERYTRFTGVLIKVLKEGIENNRPTITLNELFQYTRRKLIHLKAPEPQKVNFQDAENIVLAWNQAFKTDRRPFDCSAEMLYYCHDLLRRAETSGGEIWFAGLTSGFGPVHNIPAVGRIYQRKHPGSVVFGDISTQFNLQLTAIISGAGYGKKVRIVNLKKELVKPKFIVPLYKSGVYADYVREEGDPGCVNRIARKVRKFQGKVERAARVWDYKIAYVDDLRWQAIVTRLRDRGAARLGCVVIKVGSKNVGEGPASGYYCETLDECEKWKKYINELYDEAVS